MRKELLALTLGLLVGTALTVAASAQGTTGTPGAPTTREFPDARVLPIPTPPFAGDIQPNLIDSKPGWPPTISPPEGAPNVLLILIDDAGFGRIRLSAASCPHRRLMRLQRMVCATRRCTTRRCARRRARRY